MVSFHTEPPLNFSLGNEKNIHQWISRVIEEHNSIAGQIQYIFCSDDYLLALNEDWLSHNTFTDIITFDLSDEDRVVEGDVFISIERVRENAEKFNASFDTELNRVMIHGILHLLGYQDKTEAQKREMRTAENKCLELFRSLYDER